LLFIIYKHPPGAKGNKGRQGKITVGEPGGF
jgi:hypothetical protein